ncbi:MAG: PAS domain S-box protein [Archaeoglobaceae archaeon]
MVLENVEFLKVIIDKMLTGILIADDEFKILYVNDIFSKFTKYSFEELKGISFLHLVHENSMEDVKNALKIVLSGKAVRREFEYYTKKGEVRCSLGMFLPFLYKNKLYIIGNFIDITREKELERELRESEEFYRNLIYNSESLIYIMQEGKFVYVNKKVEELTGYRKEELIGMEVIKLIHPADRDKFERCFEEKIEKRIHNLRIITKDGRTCWLAMNFVKINFEGKPAFFVSGVDTTEILTLNEELKKKNEYFSLLSRILRHDIINDLAVIKAAIEIGDRELLKKAYQKIDWILEKINDIKSLEEAVGVIKSIDVAEIVRSVVEKYKEEANFEMKLEDVKVMANEALKSVVENLINNAIIHSQVSPVTITVEVFREGNDCIIKIADNGVGIPEELKDKIFEAKFSRKGGGLGLFLVKKIVEMFGGKISLRDNIPRGALFEVRIPISKDLS